MKDEVFSQRIQDLCSPISVTPTTKLTKRELRSEDRDKNIFPDPSDITFDLGGTFRNIESISIDPQGLEFPNTLDGITLKNNSARWCFLTNPSKVYECFVPRGNYVLDSILSILIEQMNASVKTDLRVFTVQFVRESRMIQFTSYLNATTPTDPLFIQASIPLVLLTMPNHGFEIGDQFLLTVPSNAGELGGLSSSDLSGIFQILEVQDTDHFTFELSGNDIPYNSGQFGGNNVLVGRLDAFKFIDSPTSVLPQVGFVAEDSATVCQGVTNPFEIAMNTNGFLCACSSQHFCVVGDKLLAQTPNGEKQVTVIEVLNNLTFRIDTLLPLTVTILTNKSLTNLYLPNICEGKGKFDSEGGAKISGPGSDLILPTNIFPIDNDHVVVRTTIVNSNNKAITFRVSSPTVFGFNSIQTSLINGVSLQYINLQGMTSIAITLPDIETNYHAKNVQRIWTKIQLSDQATSDLFNTQSSNQGTFKWPDKMDKLKINIVTMQNDLVDFQGMNYSLTIYIRTTEEPKLKYKHKLYYPLNYEVWPFSTDMFNK